MYYKTQTFLVAGISRSGAAAARFLLARGAKAVFLYDDISDEGVRQNMARLCEQGAKRAEKEDLPSLAARCDVLVLSPGIPIDHALPVLFKKEGKAIVGEAELAAREMRCPVVAVTGTNGKTTTVSLIEHILNGCGVRALACGNIGRPMADCLEDAGSDAVAVAEISSFQLETLTSLRPHVAVVLNISEDHLDRHYTMENYVYLKRRLLKNSTESEYAVLNYDDGTVRSFAEATRARVVWFSAEERVDGAYIQDGALFYGAEKIADLAELPFEGAHNVSDALAAVCACKLMGAGNAEIAAALKSFRGIRHRLQPVGEVDGVRYACSYVELGDPGLPHAVVPYHGLKNADENALRELGRAIRWNPSFPKGANVNFYEIVGEDRIFERTFERGVEDFTYACGTGTGSVVTVLTLQGRVSGRGVQVDMTGGRLVIDAEREGSRIAALYLTGPTNVVCKGEVTDEDLIF